MFSIFTREPMYRSMWIINPVRTGLVRRSAQVKITELLLGYWANDNNMNRTFKGKISDFRVYDQVLSELTEISSTTMALGEDLTPVNITSVLEVNASLNTAFTYTITSG